MINDHFPLANTHYPLANTHYPFWKRKNGTRDFSQRAVWSFGHAHQSRSGGQGIGDFGERLIGVRSQGRNGKNTCHDDQREHDGIFHGGGPVFSLVKIENDFSDMLVHFHSLPRMNPKV
jgi:hypothetical protein